MPEIPVFQPSGVIPAVLLPFQNDFRIDEAEYLSHLHTVASVDGISAVTVNGHASEVSSCTAEEQRRLLAVSLEAIGHRLPVVSGIFTDSSLEAARLARTAEVEGAAALLVFPPSLFSKGVQVRDDVIRTHLCHIASATDLPLILFQYPLVGGSGYRIDTLLTLAETVPSLTAIKDHCGDPAYHERTVRELKGHTRPLSVLTTHSSWLLQSLVVGCDGILSGSGSVVAAWQVALWDAIRREDLISARGIAERLYQWTRTIYRPPAFDAHSRMKVALQLTGLTARPTVRPPLTPLPNDEVATIKAGLVAAGLLDGPAGSRCAPR